VFNKDLFKKKNSAFKTWGKKKRRHDPRPPSLKPDRGGKDPQLQRYHYLIGNKRVADECWRLHFIHPKATLPELVCMEYLLRKQKRHIFQVFGIPFARPDFLVYMPAGGMIWMVQGEYWHTLGNAEAEDAVIKRLLLGYPTNGTKIYKVVEVWENDVYGDKRERTLDRALAGIERRPR
jgi:hypothetical protein